MFPDNIFQAAFQQVRVTLNLFAVVFAATRAIRRHAANANVVSPQAHTVYVPKTQPFRNMTDTISTEVMGDVELTRVTQYRSGTNTLGIVFFCLVFGTFLGTLGEKGQIVIDFFKAVFEVIMRMVSTVM